MKIKIALPGLTTESFGENAQGMFGYVGKGGVVKNVALIGGSVSGNIFMGTR